MIAFRAQKNLLQEVSDSLAGAWLSPAFGWRRNVVLTYKHSRAATASNTRPLPAEPGTVVTRHRRLLLFEASCRQKSCLSTFGASMWAMFFVGIEGGPAFISSAGACRRKAEHHMRCEVPRRSYRQKSRAPLILYILSYLTDYIFSHPGLEQKAPSD
jgi:hypothetical protein